MNVQVKSPSSKSQASKPPSSQSLASKPPRRRQEDRSAATRARILEACTQSLYEEGYGASSMVRVCERAQVSRGAMLNQFPTKADLMRMVMDNLYAQQVAFVNARLAVIDDPVERFRHLLDATWEASNRPIGYAFLEILVGSRSDPALSTDFQDHMRGIVNQTWAIIEDHAQAAHLTLGPSERDFILILSLTIRGMLIESLINPKVDPERVILRLSELRDSELLSGRLFNRS